MGQLFFDRGAVHASLVRHEGLRLKPYVDTVGKITIGVGHNLTDVGITHDQALALLDTDLDAISAQLLARWPWLTKLSPARVRALVDLAFQFGVAGLAKNQSDVMYDLERGCWECAARRLEDTNYAKTYPTRAADNVALLRQG